MLKQVPMTQKRERTQILVTDDGHKSNLLLACTRCAILSAETSNGTPSAGLRKGVKGGCGELSVVGIVFLNVLTATSYGS